MRKNALFVTAFNLNQKIREKTKVDRCNFDRVDQKKKRNDSIHHMYLMIILMIDKNSIKSANYDKLRRYQKFYFVTEDEKTEHQKILRFNVEI